MFTAFVLASVAAIAAIFLVRREEAAKEKADESERLQLRSIAPVLRGSRWSL